MRRHHRMIGLLAIAVGFLIALGLLRTPDGFGFYHDDSLYWSSARSLAEQQGYRMPSVPGEPPQTKYPVLFPWLLSWVWSLMPQFPANLALALAVPALFGLVFLAGTMALLLQLGLPDGEALALTAVCAFHPVTLQLSGLLLSDIAFASLAVWAMVFAWKALRPGCALTPRAAGIVWLGAGVLAGLCVLTRSIGVAVVVGMVMFAVSRRGWHQAAVLAAVGFACFLAPQMWAWQAAAETASASPLSGFEQTRTFYTSYVGFWRISVPDLPAFLSLAVFNLTELLKEPSVLALMVPAAGFAPGGLQAGAIALSFLTVKGMVERARGHGWHPVHFALLPYAVVALLWNYTLLDRFFLLFLPLFLAGASHEITQLARNAAKILRGPAPALDRAVSLVLVVAVGGVLAYGGYCYLWQAPTALAAGRKQRRSLAVDKQQAYAWIQQNTAPGERFIAYEDVALHLYTGRQAMRPLALSTAAFYGQDQAVLDRDLERIEDTAKAIGAKYWLVAADDYQLESAQEWITRKTAEVMEQYQSVFESDKGRVRIYRLTPVAGVPSGEITHKRVPEALAGPTQGGRAEAGPAAEQGGGQP